MRHKTSVWINLLFLTCLLSSSVRPVTANAPADGNTSCARRSGSAPDLAGYPSLRFDREADRVQDDEPPQPAAGFDRYRGHDRIIYWSEQR